MARLDCALATTVLTVGLCLQTTASAQVGPVYIAEDIGSLGGQDTVGASINDQGDIAGFATTPDGTYHAIRYSTDHGLEIIDAPPAPPNLDVFLVQGSGINNAGDVVGVVLFNFGAASSGFVARRGQPAQFLTGPNGIYVSSSATATNDNGVVTGAGQGPNTFRWYPTGLFDDLGDGQTRTVSWGINGSGQLTGFRTQLVGGSLFTNAFRYTDGTGFVDLGSLGSNDSAGVAINTSGVVVGWSRLQPGVSHAFRADPGQPMQDLGTLGGPSSGAQGINDAGTIVGWATLANMQQHAFVRSDADGMIDLNDRVASGTPRLDIAYGINRSGQIVVTYSIPGQVRTFRLTPAAALPYRLSVLYDETKVHHIGSTVPIKVALVDQSGQNVSGPAITLTASSLRLVSTQTSGVLDDSGNANADNAFRYDASSGAYIYNLATADLTSGIWELRFVASAGPTTYSVQFQLR